MTSTIPSWQGLDLAGGRYHVTGRLGSGGMAEVFKAWDRNLQTEVVIKVPLPHLLRNPTFAARFSHEVRALVRLAHPHIVKVLDVGDNAGTPFAVLQYLSGGSLRDRQVRSGAAIQALPPASLTSWLEGVAEALDFLHAQGFVHRDVKPGNILFDGHGNAYLGDFGIIKALAADGEPASNLTRQGTILGTLPYLAPEVLLGRRYDGRADQFALAVTVYEVLSARYPFQGKSSSDIMTQHTTSRPLALSELVGGIPEALARAVLQALSREPTERFVDCTSFAHTVLAALRAPAPSAREQPVHLPCPLCQELLGLMPSHRGQRVRCPSCKAELLASPDLRRVTALVKMEQPPTPPGPAPEEDELPPQTFSIPLSTEEVDNPQTFSIPIDLTGTDLPPTPGKGNSPLGQQGSEPLTFSVPIDLTGAHQLRASALQFLPDRSAAEPRRGKKTFLVVCLALLLLSGLGFGAYQVWQLFQQNADNSETADDSDSATDRGKTPPDRRRPAGSKVIVAQKGGGDYTTLTEALSAVSADATIQVRPGVYKESLTLEQTVQLIGDGPADQIVLESSGAPCVRLQADSALLRGLTLRGKLSGDTRRPALEIPMGQLVAEDCDISSEAEGGVAGFGPRIKVVLRKCKVHDCQGPGVLIHTVARATLEDCIISGNAGAGVEVREGATADLSKCQVHDGKDVGLLISRGAKGTVQDCQVFGNTGAGVMIKEGGNPTLKACELRDGRGSGLVVTAKGEGLLDDCEVFGNAGPGVVISKQSTPTLRKCQIHDGKRGVLIDSGGAGKLEECTIAGNALSGVEVGGGGTPLLQKCTIRDGKGTGVLLGLKSKARLQGCLIHGNLRAGVEIGSGADPTLKGCEIYDGKGYGVSVHTEGTGGTLDDCDVRGNALAGVLVSKGAAPLLRQCKVHANKRDGLFFRGGAKGVVDTCTIYGNELHGVESRDGADPVLRHCKIHGGKQAGVSVLQEGKGTLEDCSVYANTVAGIWVSAGKLDLKKCRIYDENGEGLLYEKNGTGSVADCTITRSARAGVAVRSGANPVLRGCKVSDGKSVGLAFTLGGVGKAVDCDVRGNALEGVEIKGGGDPTLQQCRIFEGEESGIHVSAEGKGTFEDCDVHDNQWAGVMIEQGGNPLFVQSRIHTGKQGGIWIRSRGKGKFRSCLVFGNTKAGVEVRGEGSEALFDQCKVYNDKLHGFLFHQGGKGTLKRCKIYGNGLWGVEIRDGGDPLIQSCDINRNKRGGVHSQSKGLGTVRSCDLTNNQGPAISTDRSSRLIRVGKNKI